MSQRVKAAANNDMQTILSLGQVRFGAAIMRLLVCLALGSYTISASGASAVAKPTINKIPAYTETPLRVTWKYTSENQGKIDGFKYTTKVFLDGAWKEDKANSGRLGVTKRNVELAGLNADLRYKFELVAIAKPKVSQ